MPYVSQIEAAPGHPGANSYVTVEEAEAYFSTRYPKPAAWDRVSGAVDEILERKERALISASRMIGTQAFGAPRSSSGRGEPSRIPVRPFSEAMGWVRPQGLFFPAEGQPFLTGKADSGEEDKLIDASLAGTRYPDGYFTGAGLHVIAGANAHQARLVTEFAAATGTLTVAVEFADAIDSTTSYFLLWPLDQALKQATCEQVLYLLEGANFSALDEAAKGVTDQRVTGLQSTMQRVGASGLLSFRARALLARLLSHQVAIR